MYGKLIVLDVVVEMILQNEQVASSKYMPMYLSLSSTSRLSDTDMAVMNAL